MGRQSWAGFPDKLKLPSPVSSMTSGTLPVLKQTSPLALAMSSVEPAAVSAGVVVPPK